MQSNLKILYVWEEGHDLGHISMILPIARLLKEKGHEVKILYPATMGLNINKDFEKIINSGEFEYYPCPIVRYRQGRAMTSQLDKLEFIDSLSSTQMLNWAFKTWMGILTDENPDLVICDYSTLGLMCSNLMGISTVVVDGGFYYPESTGHIHSFDQLLKDEKNLRLEGRGLSEQTSVKILNRVNRFLQAYEVPQYSNLQDFFKCEKYLIANYKELVAVPKSGVGEYIGYIRNENSGATPQWPSSDEKLPKVFMYLKQDTPGLAKILELNRRQISRNVICYIPNCDEKIAQRFNSPYFHISPTAFDIHQILARTDVVVSNAGAGLCAHSALYGKPMLLAPLHIEAELNTAALVKLGMALKLRFDSESYFEAQIRELIRNPKYAISARDFASRNNFANVNDIVEKILELVPQSLGDGAAPVQIKKVKRLGRNIRFRDLDVIFLSYDEPAADENWLDLQKKAPWAQRVHGVKGFDAAHKAAARLSRTERFILVDGDNIVDKEFLEVEAEIPAYLEHSVLQWQSRNAINNLVYPFGGVKIWTKEIALNMQTHEAATEEDASGLGTDFWDQSAYTCFKPVFSTTHPNGSPYQAFRAGFREGVKLTAFVSPSRDIEVLKKMRRDPQMRNLLFWMSAGAHSRNGNWALYGSRLGMLLCLEQAFDMKSINDYDWFRTLWEEEYSKLVKNPQLTSNIDGMGNSHVESAMLFNALEEQFIKITTLAPGLGLLRMNAKESEAFSAAVEAHESSKAYKLFDMYV